MNHFLIGSWRAMKSGFYMTTGNDELSGWTEKKLRNISQSQTCTKKRVLVTVRWSAANLIHYSFLNPSEIVTSDKYAQQISEMHWKLQCLQLVSVNRKDPVLLRDNTQPRIAQSMLQKLNELSLKILPHPPYSPDLLPTSYHFFKHLNSFLQGKCFHNQQEAENAFQEFVESWSTDIHTTGINKHFSLAKMCWLKNKIK